MEHAEAIQKEINTELFMNEETQTIYFQKYYRTVLQYAYDSVVMTPYDTTERLSQNNNVPIPLSPEEVLHQIKNKFVDIFKVSNELLIPIIEDKLLKFKMINGTIIVGEYYEIRMNFPEIIPYQNNTLPIRITGLEFGINVEKKLKGADRIFDTYTGSYRNTKYVKTTIPMHEIDTIQILSQEAGKRSTRKKTKRSKRSRRTRRN
jgi:hypothetical protein